MISRFVTRLIHNYLQRKLAAERHAVVRYEMEHAAFLMADFVLHGDDENATLMALRFQRLEKDARKLRAAAKRR